MSSKYIDSTAIIQVIGSCFQNPVLLDCCDKYIITEDDFPDKFHQIVFGAIYKIHLLGANTITLNSVLDFLSTRPTSEAVFKKQKGEEWLLKAVDAATPSAFDYYYSRLKKFSLLRAYDNIGVDVSFIYDADNLFDVKKRQMQEDQLDNMALFEIATTIDKKIEEVKLQYVSNAYGEARQAAEGIRALIERFKEAPDIGVPLYGSIINTICRGARLKKFYLKSGCTGAGKAIPNDTVIPTPIGYRKVEDIQVGDYLFGQDGKPTKVLARYPQPEKKAVYTVHFADGRTARCCADHLWQYQYRSNGKWLTRVENTRKILDRAKLMDGAFKDNKNNRFRFRVLLNEPVEYNTKEFATDPYSIGALLNDGTIKVIPEEYLLGDIQQRRALLQGLLDTSGFIKKSGRIGYNCNSLELVKQFCELCYSLGFTTSLIKQESSLNYSVNIKCDKKIKPELFRLEKNISLVKNRTDDNRTPLDVNYNIIVDISRSYEYVDMTCFTVDNDSHLFLMNDFIVTHNTRSLVANACYTSCDKIYDDTFACWIKNGFCEPTLYITTEQELDEVQTMMLAFLSGVQEDHIKDGNYADGELARVEEAASVLEQAPLYVELLHDFSLQDVENTIAKNIRDHDIKYVFNSGTMKNFSCSSQGSILLV